MDFFVLLLIGLGIIFTTLFIKIEKKWGLIYFFVIYLLFLVYTGYIEWESYYFYHKTFDYSDGFMGLNKNDLFLGIFYLEFFFIFYFLLYFLIFPFQDKKINLQKKGYFLLRDFIILFSVFLFFWGYNDIVGKYQKYYDWYKNPDHFGGEEFFCIDKSARLLLERNYRHEVIVNPYNNFLEFYKNYGVPQPDGKILTNKLQKKLVTENFLTTCKNKKGENYYEKYIEIHGSAPYFKHITWDIDYQYFISNDELEIILEKLKTREFYIHNLIKHSYKEFDLGITTQEFDDGFPGYNLYEKIEEKRKEIFLNETTGEHYKNFELLKEIPSYNVKGKGDVEYKGEDFGIPEWFYNEMLKISGGWITFYKDDILTYTTTKNSVYKGQDLIFRNNYLSQGANGAFDNIKKLGGLFTFEFTYFDIENNKEFQEKKCKDILHFGKDTYGKCRINYLKDGSTQFYCEDKTLLEDYEESLQKYQEYNQCEQLKYKNTSTNIWYSGDLLNDKYNVLESKNIFEYNGKIGFIARSKGGYFIMYDGQQISENFDYIRTKTCCAIGKFPFQIYENGLLEFVFSRDENLFVGFVTLK